VRGPQDVARTGEHQYGLAEHREVPSAVGIRIGVADGVRMRTGHGTGEEGADVQALPTFEVVP
jgi:hypothetical protein